MIPEELLDEPATSSESSEPVNAEKTVATITPADVQRAKDIIAGKIVPPPLVPPDWVIEFYEKDFAKMHFRPDEDAIREIYDRAAMEHLYPEDIVLTFTTKAGHWAILAAGFENVATLCDQLNNEEVSRVQTRFTAR